MKKLNLSLIFSFMLFNIFLISLFFSLNFYFLGAVKMLEIDLMNQSNSFSLTYLLLFDWISLIFMSIVSLISSVVMLYSFKYMESDPKKNSFFLLVLLFVCSMFLMVMSPQMLSILLGWDGLGLVSYCLVIYYSNYKSNNSGMVTFLSNRIGDLGIIVSIAWLINFGSVDIYFFQYTSNYLTTYLFVVILLAAMTKSAQIPFSAWLPAAMAAPTPVSSLVHSSTLVTAGVYLLIRFNYLVSFNYYLIYFSCLTMLMSGASALFETDMKKVIALSTLSQLGVMMFSLSVGLKELALFHLMTHALFKSLLFLCAGFYIHSNFEWQDIRGFNKLFYFFPSISVYFSVASLALSGFPFLAGFYSKDAVIEMFFSFSQNMIIMVFLLLATGLTLTYSLRLIYMAYIFKLVSSPPLSINEESFLMVSPMFILFIFSVTGGSIFSWLLFPWVFVSLSKLIKLSIIVLLTLIYGSCLTYKSTLFSRNSMVVSILSLMWLIPTFTLNMMAYFLNKSIFLLKLLDQGWLELMGGQGSSQFISRMANKLDYSHLVNLKSLIFLMSLTILMVILL